ncbi:MAG TPA: tetratricopeptide repeat protein [Bacteroidales bacterium]|nr:tetratricopeptide repeat protein [Bacteroidales bacterium]
MEKIPSWAIYAVLVFTFLIYIRALFNGFASYDDDMYILDNPYIRSFSREGIQHIFSSFYFDIYHPLTTLTYLFEYKLFGTNPLPYHLLNILLHLLNTWLVYHVTLKLSTNKITSLLVSVLFAVHPMHVESVAWISERKDVLYSLFYLLSLLTYLRYIETGYKKKHYSAALLFFILSLLSKPTAVTIFALLIAIDIYKGRKVSLKSLADKLPFLVLSLILVIVTFTNSGSGGNQLLTYGFADRIFLFTYALSFYIVKAIIPFHMSAIHGFPDNSGGTLPIVYYASLPFILLVSAIFIYIAVRAFRKGGFGKEIVFGVCFFLITLSIALPIVPIGISITSERYSYIPYIGLFYIAGQWLLTIKKDLYKKILRFLLVIIIIVFSIQTWTRIGVWKDGLTLFNDVIKKYPDSYIAYDYRGNVKKKKLKDFDGALQDYNNCLRLNPFFVQGLIDRGDVYNEFGEYNAALADLNQAIKLDSSVSIAFNNRGMSYYRFGDSVSALRDYNKALKLDPLSAIAYNNRAVLNASKGNITAAMNDVNNAIRLDINYAEAYSNRGAFKAGQGDFRASLEDYNFSVKLNPADKVVYFNRAFTRLNLQDTSGACIDWQKAKELGVGIAEEKINQYCK